MIRGFAEHAEAHRTGAHLIYAGPAVEAVSDDPEGAEVLQEAIDLRESLPDDAQRSIHLVCLPMDDAEENAAIVNALQRVASVVVQKSIAEGFGLTVAEAMWKARPVVATAVGGIQDQIVDGESGVLLDDARDLDAYGDAVRGLLEDPERAQQDGRGGEGPRARRVPRRAQPARLPQPDLAPPRLTLGELPADEQHGPVGDARREVAERSAHEPGGEAGSHRRPRYRQTPLMAVPVSTTVTELPESRVRVEAEVPAAEVEKRVAQAAKALGRNLRIPGFRKGKVPPPVIIQRVGREAVLDEAVRESIAGWYTAAIDAAKVVPVGEPNLDLAELPGEGEPLRFSIEIGVRPEAKLGEYEGLEVGRREPEVADEAIDEGGRASCATAWPSSRPSSAPPPAATSWSWTSSARSAASRSAAARAATRWSSSARAGSSPASRSSSRAPPPATSARSRSSSPRTTAPRTWRARRPSSRSRSRRSRPRSCPTSTTTSPPRRASTRSTSCARTSASASPRRRRARSRPSSARPRSTPPSPRRPSTCPTRSSRRARASCGTRWRTRSSHQGIPRETYLQIASKTEEEVIADNREPAERDLRREAVLAAVVEAEGIEASEDDVLESLEGAAAAEGGSAKKLLERLRSSGRLDSLKADLAQRKAIDRIAESAKPVKVEREHRGKSRGERHLDARKLAS